MVLIVAPSGEKFSLDVNPNTTTLHQLKVAIQQFNGMPVSNQRLFLSQSLRQNDSDLISNLGIQPFLTLTLQGADDTIGASSSTVKEELVKEVETDSDSESDDEDAKAREEASEYFIDSDLDVDDKIEKKYQNDHLFEIRRKRLAAEIEDQYLSAMFKKHEEKLFAEMKLMHEQEYKKFLEENKNAMKEDRKQAKKEAKKKAKKAKKEIDMKAEEAKAKEE